MKALKDGLDFKIDVRPNILKRFFIWCSGASTDALYLCPTEWNKFSIIGATIFITAILSFVSGSYFLSYVFTDKMTGYVEVNWLQSIAFGLIWAFLIFTLDRSIIVSIKKTDIFWQEFRQGIIRIILAIFIGVVIATPIELKLFRPEIINKVEDNNRKDYEKVIEQTNVNLNKELQPLQIQLSKLEKIRNEYYKADSICTIEIEGLSATGKIGKGPAWREKENTRLEKKAEWDKVKSDYDAIQLKISQITQGIKTETPKVNTNINDKKNQNYGVEQSVKALYQLSGLHWFITLLFILIECLPVISKLMSKRGPYDEILDRIEYVTMVEQKEVISQKNSEINELLIKAEEAGKLKGETFIQSQKDKLDAELKNNKIILDKIAAYQQEIALLHIENWYKTEKVKAESTINKPKFVDIFWKQKDAIDSIEYCFRNGSVSDNELLYFENGHLSKGKWQFDVPKNEIKIDLLSNNIEYVIVEVKETRLRLKDKETNEILNFEKV